MSKSRLVVSGFIFGAVLCTLICFVLTYYIKERGIRQSIYQDVANIDFGSMPVNTVKEKIVRLDNPYAVPIKIISANTSCGCSKATVSTVQMVPGEKNSIIVKVAATEPAGNQRVMLSVTYQLLGETKPRTEAKIMLAHATDYALFSEDKFDFGVLNPKDACNTVRHINLIKNSESQWDNVIVEADPGISATAKQESLNRWLLDCNLTAIRLTTGPVHGKVGINFLSHGRIVFTKQLIVQGYVRGMIAVQPQSVFFGVVKAGTPATMLFSLQAVGVSQIWENVQLQWQVPPSTKITALNKQGSNYTFSIELTPPDKPGIFSDVAFANFVNTKGNVESIGVPYTAFIE